MDMSSFFICFILFLHRMREHDGLITEFLPQCVNRLVELMLAVALLDILGGIKQRKLLARLIFRQQIGSRDRQQEMCIRDSGRCVHGRDGEQGFGRIYRYAVF